MPTTFDFADIPEVLLRENSSMAVPSLQLRAFQLADATAFRRLNEAWIEKHFGLEPLDREILNDPVGHVLQPGGRIFMACRDGRAIGCCALVRMRTGVYEVAKMAVDERERGQGVGRKLLVYTIEQARAMGATLLTLASNDLLANAVHLYEAVGFRHVPRPEGYGYVRANVFMEMTLGGTLSGVD